MKKITLLVAVAAFLLGLFAAIFTFFFKDELVYVDVNRLIEGYSRTKIVKKKFDIKSKNLKGNIDSLLTDWQKELASYEKERGRMTDKELKLKKELLNNKQDRINRYQEVVQKQIREEDQKVTQTVINDINDYITDYGKSHGYKIIFGASGKGSIMFADKETDLTEDVLTGLNKQFNGE